MIHRPGVGRGRVGTALLVLAALAATTSAAAAPRPYDAPILAPVTGAAPTLPPLPPEYLSHDEQGVVFSYHPSARERVRPLFAEATRFRARLQEQLGKRLLGKVDVRVALNANDFRRVLPKGAPLGTSAVALHELRAVGLRVDTSRASAEATAESFRHAMAHLALDELTGAKAPRWLHQGFSLHMSGEAAVARSRALWWAALDRKLVPVTRLDDHLGVLPSATSIPGAEAADFTRFLIEERPGDGFAALAGELEADRPFEEAVAAAYQRDLSALEGRWRRDVARRRAFLPVLLAGMALWMLVAAAGWWRRRRRRLDESKAAPADEEAAELRRALRRGLRGEKDEERPRAKSSGRRINTVQLPEPEVPRVSHNGRWHTLH